VKSALPKEIVNRATGERIVFLRTAEETNGELLEMDDFWVDADHRTPAHIHPEMEERWEVIAGRVRFEVGGIAQTAAPGDTMVAPPGTPHSACSVASEPVHLRIQMRPALGWQEFVERLFALASPAPGSSGSDSVATLMAEFKREIAPAPQR